MLDMPKKKQKIRIFYPNYCKKCDCIFIAKKKRDSCPQCNKIDDIISCVDHMDKQELIKFHKEVYQTKGTME